MPLVSRSTLWVTIFGRDMPLDIETGNSIEMMYYGKLSPELVRHAQLVVCGMAKDLEDAELLLRILQLKGA